MHKMIQPLHLTNRVSQGSILGLNWTSEDGGLLLWLPSDDGVSKIYHVSNHGSTSVSASDLVGVAICFEMDFTFCIQEDSLMKDWPQPRMKAHA